MSWGNRASDGGEPSSYACTQDTGDSSSAGRRFGALVLLVILFSFFLSTPAPAAEVCKPSKNSTWKLDKAKATLKAKTIFVMRVIARIEGREKNAYRLEIIRTLKGTRVEQMGFDLVPPKRKFPKDIFKFEMGPDCKPRGNLVTDQLYIFYPDMLENLNAIVPVKTMDDPAIDEIDALVAATKAKPKE